MDTSDNTIATYTLPTGEIVTVDAIDADLLRFKWSNNGAGYAYRKLPTPQQRVSSYMHIEILARILGRELVKGEFCDHKDKNPFNNRRNNLRLATKAQNQQNHALTPLNTSGYKGVSWSRANRKWLAQIRANGVYHYLGYFNTAEEASEAYKAAATELHGDFARY